MGVPLLDLQAQYRPIRDEILAAIARVSDSQQFIGGPEIEAFEREIASDIGVAHAVGLSSGTDALLVALMALGIGPGDEVITPTFSFFATAGCVSRAGAIPRLVDIDPDTFNVDPAAVAAAITPRTRAIIPVHLYGQCAEMDAILDIARQRGIAVIEDAAQAIGASYKGRQAGTMGTVGCFSFFPSKNLGAFGDGGLLTTNDDALAHEVRLLRNHGAEPKYFHKRIGGNFRLDALQAAVLRVKRTHLDGWTDARRRNAERYDRLFASRGTPVGLPVRAPERRHIFNQYVVRVAHRDGVRQEMTARGIGNEVYYPVPFHLQECFASLGYRAGDFPVAERAAAEVLALPIYGELTETQQEEVVDALCAAVAARPAAGTPQ
jgi:dTDP-4-amino-4,6-dideoxygalactose transaminase